jgi:uncharacterized delta-60 repeat protein
LIINMSTILKKAALSGAAVLSIIVLTSCSRYGNDAPRQKLSNVACTAGSVFVTGRSIRVLSDGGFIVAGTFDETVIFGPGEPNQTSLTSRGEADIFVARYNKDGTLAWVKGVYGESDEVARALAVTEDDSFYVTGEFGGGTNSIALFGHLEPNETVLDVDDGPDMFLAKYDADGMLIWVRSTQGQGDESGRAISIAPDGSVLVAGVFGYKALFGAGEPNEIELSSRAITTDAFVSRYTSDGMLQWAFDFGVAEWESAHGLHSYPDGSFLLTGMFSLNTDFDPSPDKETMVEAEGKTDVFLARYSSSGSPIWVRRAGGAWADETHGLSVGPDGSFTLTGYFGGGGRDEEGTCTFGPGEPGETILHNTCRIDMFVSHHLADGRLDWLASGGSQEEHTYIVGNAVATLPDGSVVVTGDFPDSMTMGLGEKSETTLTTSGRYDLPIAVYKPDGRLDWAGRVGGEHYDRGFALAARENGSFLVTGFIREEATFEINGKAEPLDCPNGANALVLEFSP